VVEIGDQTLAAKVRPTGDWDKFQGSTAGRIELKAPGTRVVKVRAKDAASWKAINVRAVKLTRIE